jgi:hypothetical protein
MMQEHRQQQASAKAEDRPYGMSATRIFSRFEIFLKTLM